MKLTVMVTGSGGGVGISIIKAARRAGYRLVGVDAASLSAGLLRCDRRHLVPLASSPTYVLRIIEICNLECVDAVIPGCDPELMTLSNNKDRIEAKTGSKVIVGTSQAVAIGRSKSLTQRFLKERGFNNIDSLLVEEPPETIDFDFPVVVKPDSGSGSVGLVVANDMDDIRFAVKNISGSALIQEYISSPDQEYTTGIVFSTDLELMGSITLKRQLKKGHSARVWSGDFPEVRQEMELIASMLDTPGPLNLQCRVTKDGPTVFEINPRFSGTSTVRAWLGFNGVKAVVENFINGTLPGSMNYRKDVAMVRYLNEVYVTNEKLKKLEKGEVSVSL